MLRPGCRAECARAPCDWRCLAAGRGARWDVRLAGDCGPAAGTGARGGRMVKLTAELIEQAAQYTNAVRDRELDLRGESGEGAGRPRASARPAACAEGRSLAAALGPEAAAGTSPARVLPLLPEDCPLGSY